MQIWLIVIFTGLRKPVRPGPARPGPILEEIFKSDQAEPPGHPAHAEL